MSMHPVGLGDVWRAIAAIAPDDTARWAAISATLGFQFSELKSDGRTGTGGGELGKPGQAGVPRAVAVDTAIGPSEAALPIIEPTETENGTDVPPFLSHVAELPRDDTPVRGPSIEALFAGPTAPSILRAAVVVPQATGPIDVARTVDVIATRRPLERLPRRRSWRPAQDVVVLPDLGRGMDAFAEDVDQLVADLERVVGRDAVRVSGFVGRPALGLAELGPRRGTRVLILTDLGVSTLAGPDEIGRKRWVELADLVRTTQAQVTVLVPWPPDDPRAAVASGLPLVTWDRATSVAQVLRAVRDRG